LVSSPEAFFVVLFCYTKKDNKKRIKGHKTKNPFLSVNKAYFTERSRNGTLLVGYWTLKQKKVLRKTDGICLVCGETISPFIGAEFHHVLPRGADTIRNLIGLHEVCHKQVTRCKDPKVIAQLVAQGVLDPSKLRVKPVLD